MHHAGSEVQACNDGSHDSKGDLRITSPSESTMTSGEPTFKRLAARPWMRANR
jgi:hypothetical protein